MSNSRLLNLRKSSALAVMLMASVAGWSQTQIADEAGLKAMANDLGGSYVLTKDITLTGEWTPVGTETAPFTGELDGAGHTIKGLTITTGKDNVGFFGFTKGATVKSVRFVGARVEGYKQAAIVVGQASNSSIEDVFTSGIVTGYDHVGGIVGDARGDASADELTYIVNCMSAAGAFSTTYQAGVIAGWTNAGQFTNNLAVGSATAKDGGAGGVCGMLDGSGVAGFLSNVSAAGLVIGTNNRVAGINAWKNGSGCAYGDDYDNLSSDATVYIVGGNQVAPTDLVWDSNNEGIQGEIVPAADLKVAGTYKNIGFEESVWNLSTGTYPVLKGMTLPIEGDYINVNKLPTKCALGQQHETSALSTLGRTVTITSSNPDVVEIDGTVLKFLAIGNSTVTFTTAGDNFSKGATVTLNVEVSGINYAITTPDDLSSIRYDLAGNYTIENDIDMSGIEWSPIGEFTGTLDGKGHYIKNLTFNNPDQNDVALFSATRGATIKNVGMMNANIVGNANTAAIVGQAYGGEISACAVVNSYLEGRDHVASIAGNMTLNDGTPGLISDCISDSRIVTRSYQSAGISGVFNGGEIKNCLFSGTVTNPGTTSGGIISLNESGDQAAYLHHNVVAASHIYGAPFRIGNPDNKAITFEENYALITTFCGGNAGNATTMDNESDPSSNHGKNVDVDQLRSKKFYTETMGWDFDNTWKFIEGAEGNMYPVLKWMNAPLPSVIYDMPQNKTLLYKEGFEFVSLDCIHGSWGQPLAITVTSGSDIATYVEDENALYAGDENGYFVERGDVVVAVAPAAEAAPFFTMSGENTFSVYIGREGDLTPIATAQDFININKNLAGDYELTADIDLAGVEFEGIANAGEAFTGSIEGNGHVVRNARVSFSSGSDLGIFGKTNGAEFKNIAFVDFSVAASSCNHVGFIGSASATKFDQVAVIGHVTGNDHAAIFAGDASGAEFNNCYVDGTVKAGSQIGGFAGCTLEGGMTATNSYFNGQLTATFRGWVGGFVGLIDKSNSEVTITNCASVGDCLAAQASGTPKVTAPFIAGNGAGENPNAIVFFSDNIFNNSAVMDADTEWPSMKETADGGDVISASGCQMTDMQSSAVYENIGWDFENVWTFDTSDNYLYPVLKKFGSLVTGIEDINADNKGAAAYAVRAAGNVLTVEGIEGTAVVTVSTIAGQNVATVKTSAATATVNLPGNGLYIVKVAGKGAAQSYKVVNK